MIYDDFHFTEIIFYCIIILLFFLFEIYLNTNAIHKKNQKYKTKVLKKVKGDESLTV